MRKLSAISRLCQAALLCGLCGVCGCASVNGLVNRIANNGPQPVAPDEFMQRTNAADRSETLNGDTQMPVTPAAPRANPPLQTPLIPATLPSEAAAPATQPAVAESSTTQPAVAEIPSTQPETEATPSSGQYLSLGGIVADINGTPIYINKVLRLVWPVIRNDARTMDADGFRNAASDAIARQIRTLEEDELLYAAAVRALDQSDQRLADEFTTAYRQRLITESGGSIQEARRHAAANGDDFDALVEDRHRQFMIEIYQNRKFDALVEPSAQDMRVYYRQNVDTMFTEHSQFAFDVIAIDPSVLGGDTAQANHDMAYQRAKQAHDRAAAGEDFTTLFNEYNTDPGLKNLTNNTGKLPPMPRGSFSNQDVENAVWKLQPGHVTDVIEVDGILYVAKLESETAGGVRPFEDELVQATIKGKIRSARFGTYMQREEERLMSESIQHVYPEMFQTAVDMAMQSYRIWTSKPAGS